jgi:iron-sulfur cluster repair protein YtfE (RIC family)
MAKAFEYKTKPNIFDELQEILQDMNVPKKKCGNMKWLYKNLELENMDHPDIKKAIKLLEKLLFIDKPKSNANSKKVK